MSEMVQTLRNAGYRITRQRIEIISYLADREDHPSPRQIFEAVKQREPVISLTTVYNTLASLVEMGLVKELDFEARDNRYDTNLAPHINLICLACGSITDFHRELAVYSEEVKAEAGFEITDLRIEYRGLCADCQGSGHEPTEDS
jgi:Fur family peroxide stress response transcriptional regulator